MRHPHPHHGHDAWRRHPYALRFFMKRSMQRTIFGWFGVTIVVTGAAVFTLMRLLHGTPLHHGDAPPPARVFGALALAMLFVWGASGFLARRLSRPVAELVRAAEAFGQGKLDTRVETRRAGHRDTTLVATVFNTMAERIQRQISDQRTLLAAVSHELRTPLARMTFLTERARQGDAAALASIDEEIRDMDALVGDLLATARMDFGTKERALVDASDLAMRALEAANEDPTKLVVVGKVTLLADATLVLRALVNLVENARRHGGGLVELTVETIAGRVVFTVDDDGGGLEAGEEGRVFEAFYKNPKTADAKVASSGLGLSLVRRIVEGHGGSVRAENRAPPARKGARFVMTFPAS